MEPSKYNIKESMFSSVNQRGGALMPANLTPQYIKAEEEYRQASSVVEKIAALEEMWALLPKHKGTDKLQGDIKRRLSKLRAQSVQKRGAKRVDLFHVPSSGAGQAVVVGLPNVGKSALVGALTNAKVEEADYPFSTQLPVPGMAPYQDVQMQLVDLPPIAPDGTVPPGMMGTIRAADILLLVLDGSGDPTGQLEQLMSVLEGRGVVLSCELVEGRDEEGNLRKRCLVACTQSDHPAAPHAFKKLEERYGERFGLILFSALTDENAQELKGKMFKLLDVVRVYAKVPGKPADMQEPFVLKRGSTLLDVARAVHRDLPDRLKFARIWSSEKFDGQPVGRHYVLQDKDIIELHS